MTLTETGPLWNDYKQRGCQQARAALIEAHLHLVNLTRQRLVPRTPDRLDAADLDSEGMIAVVRAVDKFEPSRGIKFSSFCISMIRGAMLEYLRAEDWTPRSVRTKQKTLAQAADSLVHALGREPEDEETAAHLGLDLEALRALQRQAQVRALVSLDGIINQYEADAEFDPLRMGEQIADPAPGPDEIALMDNESERLWQAVRWLPETEREVVCAYYDEGLTLKAIAGRLDRSESRSHQLHTQAVGRLRGFLGVPERRPDRARGREPAEVEEPAPGFVTAVEEKPMVEIAANGATPKVAEAPEWEGWTAAEDETLRELWGRREPNEIARKLGRTAAAIKERAAALMLGGGSRFGDMPPVDPRSTWWTAEEDRELRQQWGKLPPAEIALQVGRNRQAVHRRAKALGLELASVVKSNVRRLWTPAEDEQLRQLHGQVSRREIAVKLNRTVGSIACRVEALRLNEERSNEERSRVPDSPISPAAKPAVMEKPPTPVVTPRASLVDAELLAMAEIYRLLSGLDERARARVVRWVTDRWEASGP